MIYFNDMTTMYSTMLPIDNVTELRRSTVSQILSYFRESKMWRWTMENSSSWISNKNFGSSQKFRISQRGYLRNFYIFIYVLWTFLTN